MRQQRGEQPDERHDREGRRGAPPETPAAHEEPALSAVHDPPPYTIPDLGAQ
jgi:hypothetical protein